MDTLHFIRPQWLWLILPAVLLSAMLWHRRGRGGGWSEVISPALLPYLMAGDNTVRGPNLLPWVLAAWLLASVAAAGPSITRIPQPVQQAQNALVVLLDLSFSMNAGDLTPSRLQRARQKVLDLLSQRDEGQTGLIAYAGDAHVVTPLTDDRATIANLLPALNPEMMPLAGSDPVAAVAQAVQLLHSAGMTRGRILLITDAIEQDQVEPIARLLEGSGAELSVMGVGTRDGAPIPLAQGGFLKDAKEAIVIPRLDEVLLQRLASTVGGRYRRLQIDNNDLDALTAMGPMLPGDEQLVSLERHADTWEDQGYWLVLLLLPCALMLFRRGWLLVLLPIVMLAEAPSSRAQSWDDLWWTPDQQGQRALEAGDSERAEQLFQAPAWAGTAAFRGGNYDAAIAHFSEQADANGWYNRGNALARAGQLDEAMAAYRKSLELQPDQPDAQTNLELLEKLKQQQEQQQSQQQNQDQQQDQDQQQQAQEQQNQDNGEQQEQQNQDQQQGEQPKDPAQQQANSDAAPDTEAARQQPDQSEQSEEDAAEAQPSEPRSAEDGAEDEQQTPAQQAATEPSNEDEERDQALQQWLRRVPDDPSGLLREKFRYESIQRQRRGEGSTDEKTW